MEDFLRFCCDCLASHELLGSCNGKVEPVAGSNARSSAKLPVLTFVKDDEMTDKLDALNEEFPRCYRHPHVEAGVKCARCELPICPDCMISASVGYQCPVCVREGYGESPSISPRWERGSSQRAVGANAIVTKTFIGINLLIFLLRILSPELEQDLFLDGALFPALVTLKKEYYRLVTAMFLHLDFFHILFNMYALYLFGSALEQHFGQVWYAVLYFLAGLAGSVLVVYWAVQWGSFDDFRTATIGASGGVFGLFGAMFAVAYRRRDTPIWSAQFRSLLLLLGLNLFITFAVPNISWQGHVGGLVAGLILGFVYDVQDRTEVRLAVSFLVAGIMILAVAQSVSVGTPSSLF